MTQALSRRDQFALAAMAALIARPDLNVDQVAAMAALQADVMVKRLDLDARLFEDVREPPVENNVTIDRNTDSLTHATDALGYMTSEGVRVRLVDDDPDVRFRKSVMKEITTQLGDGEDAHVGHAREFLGNWYVPVTIEKRGVSHTYTGHFGAHSGDLSAAVADFLSRARRALA